MPANYTILNEQLVTSKKHVLTLDSNDGISLRRNVVTTSGSGAVTAANSQNVVATGTTTASEATLDTADTVRLQGAIGATTILNIRLGAVPSGQQSAYWGFLNDVTGVGFGVDATSPFIFTRTGGVDTKVIQSAWNTDHLDGNGTSGFTLDVTKGLFYQITMMSNAVEFAVVMPSTTNLQSIVVVHRAFIASPPVITASSMPLRVQCLNGSTNANLSVYVTSRDVAVYREDRSTYRSSAISIGVTVTTSFATFLNLRPVPNSTPVIRFNEFECSSGAGALNFRIIRGSVPANATWAAPAGFLSTETALQMDVADTAPSSATDVVYQWQSPSGFDRYKLPEGLDLTIDRPYSLQIKSLNGTGGASLNLRFNEYW